MPSDSAADRSLDWMQPRLAQLATTAINLDAGVAVITNTAALPLAPVLLTVDPALPSSCALVACIAEYNAALRHLQDVATAGRARVASLHAQMVGLLRQSSTVAAAQVDMDAIVGPSTSMTAAPASIDERTESPRPRADGRVPSTFVAALDNGVAPPASRHDHARGTLPDQQYETEVKAPCPASAQPSSGTAPAIQDLDRAACTESDGIQSAWADLSGWGNTDADTRNAVLAWMGQPASMLSAATVPTACEVTQGPESTDLPNSAAAPAGIELPLRRESTPSQMIAANAVVLSSDRVDSENLGANVSDDEPAHPHSPTSSSSNIDAHGTCEHKSSSTSLSSNFSTPPNRFKRRSRASSVESASLSAAETLPDLIVFRDEDELVEAGGLVMPELQPEVARRGSTKQRRVASSQDQAPKETGVPSNRADNRAAPSGPLVKGQAKVTANLNIGKGPTKRLVVFRDEDDELSANIMQPRSTVAAEGPPKRMPFGEKPIIAAAQSAADPSRPRQGALGFSPLHTCVCTSSRHEGDLRRQVVGGCVVATDDSDDDSTPKAYPRASQPCKTSGPCRNPLTTTLACPRTSTCRETHAKSRHLSSSSRTESWARQQSFSARGRED